MRRRSLAEIRFRMRQEVRNTSWLVREPGIPELTLAPLPLPAGREVAALLRDTAFARDTLARAEALLRGELELFGRTVPVGREVEWRKDYWSGKSSGLEYFRRIPYLNFEKCGDHKVIWELNRHQHLVTLTQAYLLSSEQKFLDEVSRQLADWMRQNPFLKGINWASALEVAFRALSWMWIEHLAGANLPAALRRELHSQLYLHGLYLSNNLSVYFSPNTHLTAEATALHALGRLFSLSEWTSTGERVMDAEFPRQVRDDGSYFEQSTYYHVYALDIFLFHALMRGGDVRYRERLARMAEFLHTQMGPRGEVSFFGDDDGGRFFHPYGPRNAFGRGSLAAASLFLGRRDWAFRKEDSYEIAAWWLGACPDSPRAGWTNHLFADSGMAVVFADSWQLVMDAGPFGAAPSAHSHADTLSFTLRSMGEDVLIDPGTYTYVADAKARDLFRGTAMHNTVRIDGLDQAKPAGAFRWEDAPQVSLCRFDGKKIEAQCRYRGFIHTRTITWEKRGEIVVVDEVSGPPGRHLVEQFWHAGAGAVRTERGTVQIGQEVEMSPAGDAEIRRGGDFGWRSPTYGTRHEATVISLQWQTQLPWRAETVFRLALQPEKGGSI